MYYLEDTHPEYEYVLYVRQGQACPFLLNDHRPYTDLEQVIEKIHDIEKDHAKRVEKNFYIDNDFYDNKQILLSSGVYYKFLRRKVADWESFTTNEEEKDNIIYLNFVTQM
jgi:hypothetical protein